MSDKKFITTTFDKFNNKTTTQTLPLNKHRSSSCMLWDMDAGEGNRNYSLAFNLRHVKTPELDLLAFDFS